MPWTGAPEPIVLHTLDGGSRDLADLNGRPVLLHFFATWCEPCIAEMAGLRRLAAGPRGQALDIVAVDVGEVDARVRRFRSARGLEFPILMDFDRAAARSWGVTSLPTSILVDPTGAGVIAQGEVDCGDPAIAATIDRLTEIETAAGRLQTSIGEDWRS